MWKSTFSSIVVICEKDPTLRRGFLNPFLSSHDNNSLVTFRSILTTLSDYCTHGTSGISTVTESSFTFHYAIPADVLRELPSYHLDNRSLSIFSEHGTMRQLQSVDSQTNLLRSVIYRSNPLEPKERKVVPRSASHDILPLVIVMWDSMEEESAENTQLQSASRGRSSPTQLRELMKESEVTAEEKMRLFIRPRSESRRSVDGSGRRNYEKPRFASILVIHFLRNRTPTLIRRLNICPDGIYVPRSIYSSNSDSKKSNECIICFANPNDVVLLPCRHKLVCRFCVCMIKRCPLCRVAINYYLTEGQELELGHAYDSEALL